MSIIYYYFTDFQLKFQLTILLFTSLLKASTILFLFFDSLFQKNYLIFSFDFDCLNLEEFD